MVRAKVAELADALDSGSSGVTPVRVQVPPFALNSSRELGPQGSQLPSSFQGWSAGTERVEVVDGANLVGGGLADVDGATVVEHRSRPRFVSPPWRRRGASPRCLP